MWSGQCFRHLFNATFGGISTVSSVRVLMSCGANALWCRNIVPQLRVCAGAGQQCTHACCLVTFPWEMTLLVHHIACIATLWHMQCLVVPQYCTPARASRGSRGQVKLRACTAAGQLCANACHSLVYMGMDTVRHITLLALAHWDSRHALCPDQ